MKKIVRITESEITNIVSKVIKESNWFKQGGILNALGIDDTKSSADNKMLSKNIGPKPKDFEEIVKTLVDKGIPPSDIESIIEILYRK